MSILFWQARRKFRRLVHAGIASLSAVSILSGGMAFAAIGDPVELIANGSFECNDQFNNNCLGFDWVPGNAGGIAESNMPPSQFQPFEAYSHTTQQYGGFDPDVYLGENTSGEWYFHTVGLTGFDSEGRQEAPIFQQTLDFSTLVPIPHRFHLSAIMSGFISDAAQVDLTFWSAPGGIDGAGFQVGSTVLLDGTLPNFDFDNLDGTPWTNDAWSEYQQAGMIHHDAKSATVRLLQASAGNSNGNDNYIDLVSFEAVPYPDALLRLEVDRDTGEMFLVNNTLNDQAIQSYRITSSDGTILAANWDSIDDNYDIDQTGEVMGAEWNETSPPDSKTELSEEAIGTGVIPIGSSLNLGDVWLQYYKEQELLFEYVDGSGNLLGGQISYTGTMQTTPFAFGDLDFDGDLDGDDWLIYVATLGAEVPVDLSVAEAYRWGDLNDDRLNDYNDLVLFKETYDAFHGAGSLDALITSIPEPSAALLWGFGVAAIGLAWHSERR